MLVLKQARHSAAFTLLMPIAIVLAMVDMKSWIQVPRARVAACAALFLLVSAQPLWFYTGGRSHVLHDPPVTPLLEPLTWMRYNTPPTSEGIRRGDVPAYGVMGYFGMGMYLNYVARRPNVGTPLAQLPWHDEAIRDTFRFQFAAREDDALRILERRRIRYVVTIPFYLFLKNGATILGLDADRWLHDTRTFEEEKVSSRFDFRAPYFGLVDSRLLLLDGSESEIRGERIPALGRFRLVHECSQPLNRSNFGDWSFDLPGDLRYCKIYEVVRGARITGRTLPYGKARLSVDVLVGNARRFTYRSSARADASGLFAFTVPYATESAGPEEVRTGGPYRIQTGDGQVFSIEVPAVAVTEGRAIEARS
jgi:asparagine N-glycosylation enzyme membrane subunit Stt3